MLAPRMDLSCSAPAFSRPMPLHRKPYRKKEVTFKIEACDIYIYIHIYIYMFVYLFAIPKPQDPTPRSPPAEEQEGHVYWVLVPAQ